MARPVYQKRGRSVEAARQARSASLERALARAEELDGRRIGWQLDLWGGEVELYRPRRPLPASWARDMRRYHRADCLGDLA